MPESVILIRASQVKGRPVAHGATSPTSLSQAFTHEPRTDPNGGARGSTSRAILLRSYLGPIAANLTFTTALHEVEVFPASTSSLITIANTSLNASGRRRSAMR